MTKKILCFTCALAIVLSLVLVSASSAWAKDTAQLDYADIASRVPQYNKNMDILQRQLPMAIKSRDDLAQLESSMSAANSAARSLSGMYTEILQNPTSSDEQRGWASMMLSSLSANQMSLGGASFDSIDMGIAQLKIAIPQSQAQLISSGQQLYTGYHKLQDEMAKLKASRVLLEESVSLAQAQLKAGLGTELAVKEAQLAIAELDTGLKLMESQGAQMLDQLKVIVGWPQEQIIKLGSIPRPNREFLGKIKQAEDIEKAQENSYSLQLKQAELRFTSSDSNKNLIKLEIESKLEQVALAVNTQYYKITDANSTLLLEEERLAVAEEKIKQTRLQHQLGLIAEIALQAEETAYATQQDAVISAMNALFGEIEVYKNIVAGLN